MGKDMSRDLLLCVCKGAENMILWCYVLVRWLREYALVLCVGEGAEKIIMQGTERCFDVMC